ncbi:MAG: response regulator [Caulobacteraceae bacterium]
MPDHSLSFASESDIASADGRLKAREQVFALLSHEIRTPLNGVLGMAGLLASTRLDATQQAYLATLRESGEHLLSLVNDVLDLAKLESGKIELELVDTDVERLLQGVCELLSPRAHASGVDIAWATQALPRIRTDDGRLRQILFNLAGNAVKMTTHGGVLVSAHQASTPAAQAGRLRLRFRIKDTGPGLPQEAQGRVFEEFVQTDAGARAGGAGLGLAIVKRLAEAFEGEVGVDSRAGEGATFWFEADFTVAPPAAYQGDADQDLSGLKVAIVSASSIVREAAAVQIKACGGQALIVESTAQLERQACDAILLDPDPAIDPALCPMPRQAPAIVLLTPEARDKIDAYRAAGFAGYLIKPLRRASLAARVLAVQAERHDAPTHPVAPALIASDDERAGPDLTAGLRVLLAEDNPVNALLAKALLGRVGCSVDRVANGQEALEALQAAPYDVVLMDMRMPIMDGLTAAKALRARGDATPIIALTANAFEDDRRACLDAGMNDFLTKPMDDKALRAALAKWAKAATPA